ncbi:MAG: hypothetical protein KKB62_03700 [Nanoarchaeota archaeon]|nr:hypothetical protein [Nanoarchaeota archaeon]
MESKKGVSEVVGYVLLITFGIVLAVLVYGYLRTYIPSEEISCPDGVSLFVQDYSCGANSINITIKNNGKFNVEGYFIHATRTPDQPIATLDLSKSFNRVLSDDGFNTTGVVYFHIDTSSLVPNEEIFHSFDLDSVIYSLEIIPARFQQSENSLRFVSCGEARIREVISCEGFGSEES